MCKNYKLKYEYEVLRERLFKTYLESLQREHQLRVGYFGLDVQPLYNIKK